jgi:hypothetical protein
MRLIVGLMILLLANHLAAAAPPAKPTAQVGINLAGTADWNSELPFVDVFRQSRPWVSQQQGKPWGQGPALELDQHGWVKNLGTDCWAETPLCTIDGGHYPSGIYTVLYDGEGKLDFAGAASLKETQPGRLLIDVDSRKGGFFLKLMSTNPSNHVRNIRVIMPGHEQSYQAEPWNPAFLKLWRGMACLRFMDFMHTNGSKIEHWSQRPTSADATFSQRGVPLEWMIDLANRQQADPWFCIPHRADDEYVEKFAAMVEEKLDPKLKAYIEYSNEVWNGGSEQHHYAGKQGQELGFAKQPWEAAWRFTAHRSVEIFALCAKHLGRDRMVRVLASQAGNAYVAEQILAFEDAAKHADALAIAPYLTLNVAPDSKPGVEEVAGWSAEQVLDYVERHSLPESTGWIAAHRKVADQYGLKLLAYEGGQHLLGVAGGENNEALMRVLQAANAHPRMGELYTRYFDVWQQHGGDLFCHFSSVGVWSKWGSWSTLQHLDDDPRNSPKHHALVDWARQLKQAVE